MPRSLRNTMQRHCDQAVNAVDRVNHHIAAMFVTYVTGQMGADISDYFNSETGEWTKKHKYPEQTAMLNQIAELMEAIKKLIQQFKSDYV